MWFSDLVEMQGAAHVVSGLTNRLLRARLVQYESECVLLNSTMHAFGRHVRWLVVEPDAAPFLGDLPHVFGLIDKLVRARNRVRRILIDKAPSVGESKPGHCG